MDNAQIPLEEIISYKRKVENKIQQAKVLREKFVKAEQENPEALRTSYNRLINASELNIREMNQGIIKADESIKNLEEIKSIFREYESLVNELTVIINNAKMKETLQEKARKAIKENNITTDNPIVQTVIDNSFLEGKGGKTLRKKNKRRISKKKKSRVTRRK